MIAILLLILKAYADSMPKIDNFVATDMPIYGTPRKPALFPYRMTNDAGEIIYGNRKRKKDGYRYNEVQKEDDRLVGHNETPLEPNEKIKIQDIAIDPVSMTQSKEILAHADMMANIYAEKYMGDEDHVIEQQNINPYIIEKDYEDYIPEIDFTLGSAESISPEDYD